MVFILFLLTTVISFAGSLQAGPVNTYLLHLSLQQRAKNRIGLAIAGSVAEVLYAGFSVFIAHALAIQAAGFWFDTVASLILIGVGLGLVSYKSKPMVSGEITSNRISPWVRTFALGLANPQLIIFWSANAGFLMSIGLFGDSYIDIIAFSLGAGAGAFLLLSTVLRVGTKLEEHASPLLLLRINQVLGGFLLVVGLGRLVWMIAGQLL